MTELERQLTVALENLERETSNQCGAARREITELRQEFEALKGLMLSRLNQLSQELEAMLKQ